jgi:hypothetical protein
MAPTAGTSPQRRPRSRKSIAHPPSAFEKENATLDVASLKSDFNRGTKRSRSQSIGPGDLGSQTDTNLSAKLVSSIDYKKTKTHSNLMTVTSKFCCQINSQTCHSALSAQGNPSSRIPSQSTIVPSGLKGKGIGFDWKFDRRYLQQLVKELEQWQPDHRD